MVNVNITPDDVQARLPRRLAPAEVETTQVLIEDAKALVDEAFLEHNRSVESYLQGGDHRERIYKMVVVDMVAAPVLVGISRGLRSAQSTTAHVSDSATWDNKTDALTWGGVLLTDAQKALLGLKTKGARIRYNFPSPSYLGEVREHERNR